MNTEAIEPNPAMIIEFLYQVRYGLDVSENSTSKLIIDMFLGRSSAVFRVPDGLIAAEMMNTMGNKDQTNANMARPCRHHIPRGDEGLGLSLIHISEPTRRTPISYAGFCLK